LRVILIVILWRHCLTILTKLCFYYKSFSFITFYNLLVAQSWNYAPMIGFCGKIQHRFIGRKIRRNYYCICMNILIYIFSIVPCIYIIFGFSLMSYLEIMNAIRIKKLYILSKKNSILIRCSWIYIKWNLSREEIIPRWIWLTPFPIILWFWPWIFNHIHIIFSSKFISHCKHS